MIVTRLMLKDKRRDSFTGFSWVSKVMHRHESFVVFFWISNKGQRHCWVRDLSIISSDGAADTNGAVDMPSPVDVGELSPSGFR